MNGHGKSDRPVVPPKPPNKGDGAPSPAEGVEGRGLAKENLLRQNQSIGHRVPGPACFCAPRGDDAIAAPLVRYNVRY